MIKIQLRFFVAEVYEEHTDVGKKYIQRIDKEVALCNMIYEKVGLKFEYDIHNVIPNNIAYCGEFYTNIIKRR